MDTRVRPPAQKFHEQTTASLRCPNIQEREFRKDRNATALGIGHPGIVFPRIASLSTNGWAHEISRQSHWLGASAYPIRIGAWPL